MAAADSEDLEAARVMAMPKPEAVKIATDRWSAASGALKEIDAELAALTDRCRDIGSRRDDALASAVRWSRCLCSVRGRVGDEAVGAAKGGTS